VRFDADELARIVRHGPWPPPFERDATNRVSGNPAAIAFGRQLFFEPRFSPGGYISCVACHQPDRGSTDNLPRARGLAPVDRNAIALQNLGLQRRFGWAGSSDSLWMASLRLILDEREIGGNAAKVARVIHTGDGVACRYRAAFGADPARQNAEAVLVNVGKALAAYQETLVTGRYSDDMAGSTALATRAVRRDLRDRGKWRTPSLRNVGVTAPYLHNGVAASLHDGVRRYARWGEKRQSGDDERDLRRVDLADGDIEDLVAFLHTLTDADGARRPLAPLEAAPCD